MAGANQLSNADAKKPKSSQASPVVVGIDLGTTRSVIAYVDNHGAPHTIENREGDLTTPSAALIEDDNVTIGKEALKARAVLPDSVAVFAKREMGKEHYSRPINGHEYSPEMIQSLVLGKLKRDAEAKLGRPIKQAVITVPAYFNEPKRRSTIDAAMLAGLEVLAIINEPTATAVAYGLEKHAQILGTQTVLVYDLGGGTFDVTLVRVDGKDVKVIATDGNSMLGGLDWDRCLADWLSEAFHSRFGIDPSKSAAGQALLAQEAEDIKHSLTARKSVKVRFAFDSHILQTEITREAFEELTAHLLDRTRFTVRKLMTDAKHSWDEIDQVILVGGSTRMPQVGAMVQRESSMEPNLTVSADEAIAHGAAIYAEMILGEKIKSQKLKGHTITDVNAHNLCVLGVERETKRRRNHVMIARNTPLPATKTTRFETIEDDQRSVVVKVVEGGDSRGRHGTEIGRCRMHRLPTGMPAGSPVDVTFSYDRDGLIRVSARIPSTGQKTSIEIDRNAGLSRAERDQLKEIHAALELNENA